MYQQSFDNQEAMEMAEKEKVKSFTSLAFLTLIILIIFILVIFIGVFGGCAIIKEIFYRISSF